MILILIPEVWTEEMKLLALHISYSSFPFLARIRIRKNMRIRAEHCSVYETNTQHKYTKQAKHYALLRVLETLTEWLDGKDEVREEIGYMEMLPKLQCNTKSLHDQLLQLIWIKQARNMGHPVQIN